MTDGSPVSLEYEDAGLFLCVWMWLREAGEGGIGPGVDGVVDAVEVLWGGWREGCHLPLADASSRQEKNMRGMEADWASCPEMSDWYRIFL